MRPLALVIAASILGSCCAGASAAGFSWSGPITTHPGANLLACPSSTQCTAVTTAMHAVYTFDPKSQGPVHSNFLIGGEGHLTGLVCLNSRQCVALTDEGWETTFDPISGAIARGRNVDSRVFWGLDCFSVTYCITPESSLDGRGYTTFDASSVDANPRSYSLVGHGVVSAPYDALACATRAECVALTRTGWEATFRPGKSSKQSTRIDRRAHLNAASCPTARFCVAVDSRGRAISFDPLDVRARAQTVDGHDLNGVVCPTTAFCVAADRDGRVVYGRPGGHWQIAAVPGAQRLEAIASAGAAGYVVVDSSGNAFVGAPGS